MKKIDEKYFIKENKVNYNPTLDSTLEAEENILWRAKPLRKSFLLSAFFRYFFIAIIWLIFDTSFVIMMVMLGDGVPWFVFLIMGIVLVFHLMPVWMWISAIVSANRRQKIEEYAFTNKRILVKKGFIGANIITIPYSSITSVNLRIGLIERMCKVGDIYIVYGNQKITLEDIVDPYFIYEKLQAIANDIKTDIIYPNALRPEVNPGYKTSYKTKEANKHLNK